LKEPIEWRKIFANYTSGKRLITRIYKELKKLNSQRINDSMKRCTNKLNRIFSKEEVQMGNKYMKKCSIHLPIKKMKVKQH
jgi:hypothetical protein